MSHYVHVPVESTPQLIIDACTSKLKILRIEKKRDICRDGIKRKGHKIGVGYMKHG